MADNVTVTAGSGTTIAADDIGGVMYQRVKSCWGADGSANDTSATNPLPASLTNLEKAEDSVHITGDKGVMALGVVTTGFVGTSSTDQDYAALSLASNGSLLVQDRPNTAGGCSIFRSLTVDVTEDEIKATAGQLYELVLQNLHAAADRFVKVYDGAAAAVVVGTTVPVMTFRVKAGETIVMKWDKGLAFANGICIAATTALTDADTGAPGANEVVANAAYA